MRCIRVYRYVLHTDKYKIDIVATDSNPVYGKFLIGAKNVVTKAETFLIESYS